METRWFVVVPSSAGRPERFGDVVQTYDHIGWARVSANEAGMREALLAGGFVDEPPTQP